jgi:membrane protease YdiL (CAAX protease family)
METKAVKLDTLLISAAAVIALELAAGVIIAGNIIPSSMGLGVARILQILVMVVIIKKLEMGWTTVGISRSTILKGIQKGLVWSLCFGFASLVIMGLFLLFDIRVTKLFQMPLTSRPNEIFLYFFVGTIIGPHAEELFFRGILFGYFRKFGFATALIISALLFILPHISGSTLPITQVVGGLLFAVAYEVEKNLIVPIVIHCLGNLAIFSFSYMI